MTNHFLINNGTNIEWFNKSNNFWIFLRLKYEICHDSNQSTMYKLQLQSF